MPEKKVWIGGTPAKPQVDTVVIPGDVAADMVFIATIGSKSISYTIPEGIGAADIAGNIVDLWNDSSIAEFSQIEASDNGDGSFALTATEEGKPFLLSITIGSGNNEKQTITVGGNPTGGTFTLAVGGQVTAPIAYNATGDTVETELEALSTVGAGNISVTGDGPYEIEFIGALAGVNMTTIAANPDGLTVPGEVQAIDLGSPTGGTWTAQLGIGGTVTSALAYNISAANLQTELEGLSDIGPGNVAVAGPDGGPFTVTFQGSFNGENVEPLVVDGANLTGGLALDVTVTQQTPGGGGSNEQHTIWGGGQGTSGRVAILSNSNVTGGTFDFQITLGFSPTTILDIDDIPYDVTVSEMQALVDDYLDSGPATQKKMIVVHMAGSHSGEETLLDSDFLFLIPLAFGEGPLVPSTDVTNLTGGQYSTQSVVNPDFSGGDQGYGTGTWHLEINGEATATMVSSVDAATLKTEIEGLTAVGTDNVSVEAIGEGDLSSGGGWRLTFQGDLASQATGLVIVGYNDSGDHVIEDLKNWSGSAGTSEVQRISVSGSPVSGEFGLRFNNGGNTSASNVEYPTGYSAAVAYNETAAGLQTILEAVTTIGTGNVACSGGPLPGTPIDVTFQGGLSGIDVPMLEVKQGVGQTTQQGDSAATITVDTTQTPVGHSSVSGSSPHDWNTPTNWNTGTLPENGDTVIIPDGDDILYGLDQSGLSLALLDTQDSETEIGLPRRTVDDDLEYLPRFLKLSASQIVIGQGTGGGSRKINIEPVNSDADITIHQSQSGDGGEEAIQIRNTNSANAVNLTVLSGQVGIATGPEDEAYIKKITQRGGSINVGSDVGLEEIDRTGGQFTAYKVTLNGTLTI